MESVYFVVALGAVAAGFVQGLSGFAFGMVAMSFWAWVLEPRLAAALTVFGSMTGQIVAAVTVRRGFDLKRAPVGAIGRSSALIQLVFVWVMPVRRLCPLKPASLSRWHASSACSGISIGT